MVSVIGCTVFGSPLYDMLRIGLTLLTLLCIIFKHVNVNIFSIVLDSSVARRQWRRLHRVHGHRVERDQLQLGLPRL